MADTDPDRGDFLMAHGVAEARRANIEFGMEKPNSAMKVTLKNHGASRMIVQAINAAAPAGSAQQVIMRQEVPGGGSIEVTLVNRIGFLVTLGSDA